MRPKKHKHLALLISAIVCLMVVFIFAVFLLSSSKKKTAPPLEVGDIIKYGFYEQDNDLDNGPEPIEWVIVEKTDDMALVVSYRCLDYQQYHTNAANITWESSTLRNWLNSEFLNIAFPEEEQKYIISRSVINPGTYFGVDLEGKWIVSNTEEKVSEILYQVESSNGTEDSIFLLSVDEASDYLSSGILRVPSLTDYAKASFLRSSIEEASANGFTGEDSIEELYRELEEEYGEGCSYWWLRSAGISKDTVSLVSYEKELIQIHSPEKTAAVRPAMWIQLNGLEA